MNRYIRSLAILGLNEYASASDIKSAYRIKAKALHPDVNPSARAAEDFLRLKTAYEYAITYKTNPRALYKRTPVSPQETAQAQQRRYGTHKNWNSQANQEARAKARMEAEIRQNEYLNSEEYKHNQILSRFFPYVALFLVAVLLVFMILLPFMFGFKGLFGVPVLFVVGFPLWWAYVKSQYHKLSVKDFKHSLAQASQTHLFWIVTFTVTNLFLFCYCTMNTILSSNLILSLFGLLIVGTKLVTHYGFEFKQLKQNYWAIGMVPFALNLLFLINYSLSFNPVSQTLDYQFSPYNADYSSLQEGLIFHPNNELDDAYFIRMHFSNDVNTSRQITYTTETGIFGIPVLKRTEFSGFR